MTFKIKDIKTGVILHERVLSPYEPWLIPLLVRKWADEAGVPVNTKDENSAGTADIDATLEETNVIARSFFYL